MKQQILLEDDWVEGHVEEKLAELLQEGQN